MTVFDSRNYGPLQVQDLSEYLGKGKMVKSYLSTTLCAVQGHSWVGVGSGILNHVSPETR